MSSLDCRHHRSRRLHAEPLESRHLLAGLVEVELFDGELVAKGDELDNEFSIAQVADPTGRQSNLIIAPSKDTSINGRPAGEPANLGPVNLTGVRVLPGDGTDVVDMRNLSIAGALRIHDTGGSDQYSVSRSSAFKVEIEGAAAEKPGSASFSDVKVGKRIDKATPILANRVFEAKNVDLRLERVTCKGGAMAVIKAGMVTINRADLQGGLTVEGSDGRGRLIIQGSRLGKELDKATPILMLDVSNIQTTLRDTRVFSKGKIDFQYNHGVELDRVQIDGGLSVSSSGELGKLTIKGSRFGKELDKASPKLMLSITNMESSISKTEIHGRVKVKFPWLPGDVDLDTVRMDGGLTVESSSESSSLSAQKVRLGKEIDKSTPILMLRTSNTNVDISQARILGNTKIEWPTAGGGGGAGKVKMADVSSDGRLDIVTTGGRLDVSLDQTRAASGYMKLADIKGEAQDRGGPVFGSSVAVSRSRFDGSLRVISDSPLDVGLQNTSAAGMYIKVGDIKGETRDKPRRSRIDISGAQLDGGLRVEHDSPADVRLVKSSVSQGTSLRYTDQDRCASAFSSYHIKDTKMGSLSMHIDVCKVPAPPPPLHQSVEISGLNVQRSLSIESNAAIDIAANKVKVGRSAGMEAGTLKGQAQSSVSLTSFHVGGSLSVRSSAPLRLTTNKTSAAADMYIKIGDIKGESLRNESSTLRINATRVGGDLRIETGDTNDRVHLEQLRIAGRSKIDLGGGDDLLSVVDSVFAGWARFDGGDGEDTLALRNVEFQGRAKFVNWETGDGTGRKGSGKR